MLNGMYRSGNIEIATTGCGNTRIYGYKPLGDTVEEHDKAVAAKANAMRVKQEDFLIKNWKSER